MNDRTRAMLVALQAMKRAAQESAGTERILADRLVAQWADLIDHDADIREKVRQQLQNDPHCYD